MKKLNIFYYATIWSFIIGICCATYLNLINFIINFVWHVLFDKLPVTSQALPFFICIPFGFIIGILIKRLGSYPLTIEEVLMSVKQEGKINYHNWWKSLTLGLISLAAGGSIGPEASTTVLGSGMVNWLGDRLRLIAYSSDWKWNHFWDTIVSKKQLKKLPKFSSLFKSKLHQKVFCLIMVMIGVVGAAIVFKLFPEEGLFGIHHRHILWQWRYSMYVIIPLIVGWSFGMFFLWSEKWSDYFAEKITISPIIKATIWGIVLALLTLITSYALYSCEFQIVPFVHQALQISPLFLLVIAVIKTLSTNIGFSLGWRGGKIFPSIFASVAVGAAIAQFLPIMPVMCVAITVSASIAVILGKPLLTAILLILLLPIELAPVILVSAYLAACLTKVSYSFRQKIIREVFFMNEKNDAITGASLIENQEEKVKSPWPGPKGMIPVTSGRADDANVHNRAYLDNILVEMRLLDSVEPDLTTEIFGKKYASPLTLAAVSHLNKVLPDKTRKPMQEKARAAKNTNTLNWIGMESNEEYAEIVKEGGDTVRIVKPYADHDKIMGELKQAEELGAVAVGMDIDHVPGDNGKYDVVDGIPLGPISFSDLEKYVHAVKLPFVAKGVLSVRDAVKARDAGAKAIVVSHHHGRVPFGVPPLKVLPAIKQALNGSGMTIFVDGSLMTGYDAYKALALGADAVLIGRGILSELLKDGQKATEDKIKKMNEQLAQMMLYTGVRDTKSFDPSVLYFD